MITSTVMWLRFAGIVLVITVLYLGRAVLVPLALAILLAFVLTPVVVALQRYVGRVVAVAVVVVLTFSLLGAVVWTLGGQLQGLAHELPAYRHTIRQRILDLRGASRGSAVEKVQEAVKDIQETIAGRVQEPAVVTQPDTAARLGNLSTAFGPLADALATTGFVVVLAVFMLLERQELRNRVIRLAGFRRIGRTTKALDEAASRISRYLLMQSLINGLYGLGVGIGLYVLDVPHALLWGFLGGILRFVPYVGPWIAALGPIALSLAVFTGWMLPGMVVLLFVVLELFTNLVLETVLYAGAAGVSAVGLLVAVAFWTWMWGPAGLLMATPLTVCLVVLSRHVPGMRFLATLLGDEPALSADTAYYQRLLAGDHDEAAEIVEAHLATSEPETVYDALMLPPLVYARRDASELSDQQEHEVLRGTATILDDVLTAPTGPESAPSPAGEGTPPGVLGYPAGGEADEIALEMLRRVLDPTRFAVEVSSTRTLSSEVVAAVRERNVAAVCIVALPPGGLPHAKYLCKKLRARFPDLKILAGRWGPPGLGGDGAETLVAAGADAVGGTLLETRVQLDQLVPRRSVAAPKVDLAAAAPAIPAGAP
jgi:predicted PurR-regulated permease PerM